MTWSRSELRAGRFYWLLDFSFAGKTWHLSEEEVLATVDGKRLQYHAGLDLGGSLTDQIDWFSDSPQPRSVNVTLTLPADVPGLVAQGHDLGGSVGKLALYLHGSGRSLVVLDGVLRDPEYETKDDPITGSLEELPFADTALWPPADAYVNAARFTGTIADSALDERYPWILGTPGGTDAYGSPGLMVGTYTGAAWLLLAGHRCEASKVWIRNKTEGDADRFTVEHASEPGGSRLVAYADLNEAGTSITVNTDDEYQVSWNEDAPNSGGGVISPRGGTMRGAGEQLRWWLQRSSLRWDSGRVQAVQGYLDSFLIDSAAIASPDSRIKPWSWIEDHLLPILPISPRIGPEGVYFALWRQDAEPVASLSVDRGDAVRASPVSYTSRDDVANRFTLSYRHSTLTDKITARAVIGGDLDEIATGAVTANALCRISAARYGNRPRELMSEVVYDGATASRVLSWMAGFYALQHREIVLDVDSSSWGYLEPGDAVTVTDSTVGLRDALAWVTSVPWAPAPVISLRLLVLSNPAITPYEAA